MLLSLLLPAAASLICANVAHAADPAPEAFNWLSIIPSEQLEHHNCYDGFQCARLAVPLDWKNPEQNHTVAIAMVKLPAVVPDDDATFAGTIIFNPGGPGISGVNAALQGAKTIQKTLADKPGIRHYEIVSFDPRGVGRTTPTSDCFRSNDFARAAFIFEDRGKGALSSGKPALSYGLGLAKFFGDHCKLEEEFKGSMEFVNTPSVARDMLEIIDKIDELRKREAAQRQPQRPSRPRRPPRLAENVEEESEQILESNKTQIHHRRRQEDVNNPVPRIQYLGYSYGTVLGNTFASMFPGRVGRMVLDGVVSAKDYYNGDGGSALDDTDKLFDGFWRGCYEVKSTICPFHLSYKTPEEAQREFWTWIYHLNRFPVAVPSANGGVMVVRGSDVLVAVGSALHNPLQKFQRLALGLYDGMSGSDLTRIASLIDEDAGVPEIGKQFKAEQAWGVMCSDGPDLRNHDVDYWNKHLQKLEKVSRLFGPFWTNFRSACSGWQFRPNWEFKSGFKTPTPSSDPLFVARPAAPLLFLSSRFDPITPLSAARTVAKGHPNSGILIQQSMGHTTLGGGPSRCTWDAVRNYFHDGKIQASEFSCPAECDPWSNDCDQKLSKRSNRDGQNWSAWTSMTGALQEALRARPWSLGGP